MNTEQQTIIEIMCEQSEPRIATGDLSREHEIESIGLNSLKFMLTIIEIEHQLKRSIFKLENMPNLKTVGDILDLVK